MIGTRLSRYRILEPLGTGAHGAVYRARDERLERDVALKVLADDTEPDARARVRRNVFAFAQLVHPRIGALFDVDRDAGHDFLVMELVPGESLAERLARGPLPPEQLTRIAAQIAEALDASHRLGVVHGDLKPANVMLAADGGVKVVDFGLAVVLGSPRGSGEHLLGTPAYVAPEQVEGRDRSPASDVYALGAVMYEMATGQPPFAGATVAALLYAVVNQPAPPLPTSLPIAGLVARCLDKDPARRPAARELAEALAPSPAREAPADALHALAVLPLENLSGDPAQEYFADGMTEALIDDLSHIGALRVISRTSVMQYKGARRPMTEIAAALGVGAVIEGTALQSGGRVRITARLVDARHDRALWSGRYERDLGDVLALQSELAQAIAREVRIQLTPEEQARLDTRRPVHPEAHLAYLQGRFLWNRRTIDSVEASITLFERAIALDPDDALAHAGLADACHIYAGLTSQPSRMWGARALEAARRAVALDPSLAEGHAAMASALRDYAWDWEGSGAEFRRAIELNPGYAVAHQWYAVNLAAAGRHAEAESEVLRAIALDPLALVHYTAASDVFYMARRWEPAKDYCRRALTFDPDYVAALTDLARVHEELAEVDEALAHYHRAAALTRSLIPLAGSACALARGGRAGEARALLAELTPVTGPRVSSYLIASIHARLGDVDDAFAWLERAWEERVPSLQWLRVHPRLDPLRSDPRFETLVARVWGAAP